LKNEKNLNLYQQKINEKLEDTDGTKDVQIEWNKIKNAIVEAAKETLGEKKGKKMKNGLMRNVERLYKKRIT
jgi:hypothetical protein